MTRDIRGVVAAVPRNTIKNEAMFYREAAEEAARMTGVLERRWLRTSQSAGALCVEAARTLLTRLNWAPDSLSLILYVTQTPGRLMPAEVFDLASDLGASSDCVCMQTNWACAGYVYGLWAAMRLMDGSRALLLVGDATSEQVMMRDRATGPLFGDAGSATAIEIGDGDAYFVLGSDGAGADKLMQPGYEQAPRDEGPTIAMDGAAVFNFTLQRVPPLVAEILSAVPNGAYARPDYLLFHQANKFMLDHLAKKCRLAEQGFTPAQIPTNIARFGNCSSASIPLLLCSEIGLAAKGKALALFGFGAGWAWGGAHVQLTDAFEVCEVLEVG